MFSGTFLRFGHVVTLFALLLLPACGGSMGSLMDTQPSSKSPVLLRITDGGVGGLTAETHYGPKAIGEALPGFTIETIQTGEENGTEWVFAAFHDGMQMVQIFKGKGGKIGVVHGVGDAVSGPNGERLGMTFPQSRLSRRKCRVGSGLWRGMAICPAANTKSVVLIFAIAEYKGPFDRLPSSKDLERATLQRILWFPSGDIPL